MIPKIIHYCWLSDDPLPDEIKKNIDGWKEILPDYEIKLWDTKRFDIDSLQWTREAFEKEKYAFASDYIRFFALYHEGGIYLDSDIEVVKSFNDLLDKDFFLGFEYSGAPEAAVIGSKPGQMWLKECMKFYENRSFINKDGSLNTFVAPLIVKEGLERSNDVRLIDNNSAIKIGNGEIYPKYYFSCKDGYTGRVIRTKETYCIHHFASSWLNNRSLISEIKRIIHCIIRFALGEKINNRILYKIREKKLCKLFEL